MMEEKTIDEKVRVRRRFTREEKEAVLKKTGCKCAHCGRGLNPWEATVDHIIPIDKGGLNDEFNLVALCLDCNENKSNFFYHIDEYYKYILPKYKFAYQAYHAFASYEKRNESLIGYSDKKYTIYPEKQKDIIRAMAKRGAKKNKIRDMAERLGIPLYLNRAYPGDAEDIMELINKSIDDPCVIIKSSYYKNDYMLCEDIRNGEVYVLRSANNKKIHGAFMFKRIDDDTIPVVQLRNIIEETGLHAKYIMTGAFVDYFAHDAFNDVMTDFTGLMLHQKIVPVYFSILEKSFVDADKCIIMPYELEGISGTLEFMTASYIIGRARENAEGILDELDIELDADEMELFVDMIMRYRRHSDIDESDVAANALLEKYDELRYVFKPKSCPIYGIGFIENLDEIYDEVIKSIEEGE